MKNLYLRKSIFWVDKLWDVITCPVKLKLWLYWQLQCLQEYKISRLAPSAKTNPTFYSHCYNYLYNACHFFSLVLGGAEPTCVQLWCKWRYTYCLHCNTNKGAVITNFPQVIQKHDMEIISLPLTKNINIMMLLQ